MRWLAAVGLSLTLACSEHVRRGPAVPAPATPAGDATSFLVGRLRPWPDPGSVGLLAVTDPATGRVATYDSALVVLVLLRAGRRDLAARVLQGLAALQGDDGRLPFSFTLPAPDPEPRFERSGAIAWAGYAAAEYLDADVGGPARDLVLSFAHRAAAYLIAHQVARPGDPRDGLVLGGTGNLRYELAGDEVREVLEPGDIVWASVEHNVDSYFFLRALDRVSRMPVYSVAASRIARALRERGWSGDSGQFLEGLAPGAPDDALALDCASWGSILLGAIGEKARADTAFSVADGRYATRDAATGARGHRPYARGPVIPEELARHRSGRGEAVPNWEHLQAVWPEGSAGVALAAWRTGNPERARAILDALEPLRQRDGSLPTSTVAVPFTLDTSPGIAGTAWAFLARFELERPEDRPTLWAP